MSTRQTGPYDSVGLEELGRLEGGEKSEENDVNHG